MAAPKSKAQIIALVNDYLADTSPNIRSREHREIETAILDRVDARIIGIGQYAKVTTGGYWNQDITFQTPAYTINYLVHCTMVQGSRAAWGISNKTLNGFKLNVTNYNSASVKFWWIAFSKDIL